ncbi:hypothetical protein WDJ51_08655 [Rathayibacter sp. YIM 133350]|uniref:hypothetical protein n=1 Tax=Rathayibacter sp. YIM 133350 TaxID=3131992 RepID=UPI00307FA814
MTVQQGSVEAGGRRPGKPLASGARMFWAYTLHTVGAIFGACAAGYTLWQVPQMIASHTAFIDAGQDYSARVSLAWDESFLLVAVAAAAFGVLIAGSGLPVLRGYRRSPIAYLLVGVAIAGVVVSAIGYSLLQSENVGS